MDEAKSTMSTDDITHSLMHDSSAIRLTALKRLCPCKLRGLSSSDDFAAVWDAIFGMVKDDCAKVRTQVSRMLCGHVATVQGGHGICCSALCDFGRFNQHWTTVSWGEGILTICMQSNNVCRLYSCAYSAMMALQVLHTICDGSPAFLETRVAAALEEFNHDSDKAIRRTAHKVLASYSRTGKWNIL